MIETNVILTCSHKLVLQTHNPDFLPTVGEIIDINNNSYLVKSIRHEWTGLPKKIYRCKLVVVELIS